jgi:hypothetical protein
MKITTLPLFFMKTAKFLGFLFGYSRGHKKQSNPQFRLACDHITSLAPRKILNKDD